MTFKSSLSFLSLKSRVLNKNNRNNNNSSSNNNNTLRNTPHHNKDNSDKVVYHPSSIQNSNNNKNKMIITNSQELDHHPQYYSLNSPKFNGGSISGIKTIPEITIDNNNNFYYEDHPTTLSTSTTITTTTTTNYNNSSSVIFSDRNNFILNQNNFKSGGPTQNTITDEHLNLFCLPFEIISKIILFLSPKDLMNISQCNRLFKYHLDSTWIWNQKFESIAPKIFKSLSSSSNKNFKNKNINLNILLTNQLDSNNINNNSNNSNNRNSINNNIANNSIDILYKNYIKNGIEWLNENTLTIKSLLFLLYKLQPTSSITQDQEEKQLQDLNDFHSEENLLIALMCKYRFNIEFVTEVCYLMIKYCKYYHTKTSISFILELIMLIDSNSDFILNALDLLSTLTKDKSNESNYQLLLDNLKILFNVVKKHIENQDVQKKFMILISNFTKDKTALLRFGNSGGLREIFKIVKHHPNNRFLNTMFVFLLSETTLYYNLKIKEIKILIKSLKILKNFNYDEKMQVNGLLSLALSSNSKLCRDLIRKNNGIEYIIKTMQNYEGNCRIQEYAMILLCNITFDNNISSKKMVKEGVVHQVLNTILNSINNRNLLFIHTKCLFNLINHCLPIINKTISNNNIKSILMKVEQDLNESSVSATSTTTTNPPTKTVPSILATTTSIEIIRDSLGLILNLIDGKLNNPESHLFKYQLKVLD